MGVFCGHMKNQTRPTPETDAKWHGGHFVSETMACEFAEKLERERDEAREELARLQTMAASVADVLAKRDAMIGAIKGASFFASQILAESSKQWQATQPLPDTASIEALAQQIEDKLKPFLQ